MSFFERLNLTYDIEAMVAALPALYELGAAAVEKSPTGFSGWAIQSDTGDWWRGFEPGSSQTRKVKLPDGIEGAHPIHEYWKTTQACRGIFREIYEDLVVKGFYPHRSRITILNPGQEMQWHQDAPPDSYCTRIHIPFITNPDCAYEVQGEGHVHMPADGHAWLVDAAAMHRAWNRGDTKRYHFLADVWDTRGHSTDFVLSESTKSIQSYHQMTGYHLYLSRTDEQG